tara:strand:+ start:2164 stop:2610 length:447 start_codon:yes stop_codon:yes gene_type:complete
LKFNINILSIIISMEQPNLILKALKMSYLDVAVSLGGWQIMDYSDTVDGLWEQMTMRDRDEKEIEKPSKEEFMLLITPIFNAKVIDIIRTKRTDLLKESDWTQLPDVKDIDVVAWADYRQLLRDVPSSLEIEFGKELDDYFPTQPIKI